MRRLRALFVILPALLLAPGCVVAGGLTPVGGYGYGYGYAQPYYAPPPPRYYAPRPVYRPYYAPAPRYYAPPPRHYGHDRGWRGDHRGHHRHGGRHWR